LCCPGGEFLYRLRPKKRPRLRRQHSFQDMRIDALVSEYFADNRVYDPVLMRWLQTDPIGLTPDNNDYRFLSNGPLDVTDPSGLANVISNYWDNWVVPAGKGAANRVYWLSQRGNPFVVIPENIALAKAVWADPRGVLLQTAESINDTSPVSQVIGQYKAAFPQNPTDIALAQRIGRANGALTVDAAVAVAVGANVPCERLPTRGSRVIPLRSGRPTDAELLQAVEDLRAPNTLPQLSGTTGREMLGDALNRVSTSTLTPAGKADLLGRFIDQIVERQAGRWIATGRFTGADGSAIFTGPGFAAVVSPKGRVFTGRYPGPGWTPGPNGVTPNYGQLTPR
jgi:RHS repeat-associated protein